MSVPPYKKLIDQSFKKINNLMRVQEVISPVRKMADIGKSLPGVTIVILNLNRPDLIIPLLASIRKQRVDFIRFGLNLNVLVGDTGSEDPAVLDIYQKWGADMWTEKNLKYHFSKNNNQLVREFARTEFVLFLNNDIVFPEDSMALLRMYQALKSRPDYGVVGLTMLFPNETIQHMGIDFFRSEAHRGFCYHPMAGQKVDLSKIEGFRKVPAVTGASLMIRRSLFHLVDGFDEGYQAECQDIALCLSVRRLGYSCGVVNAGPVVHIENGTRVKGEENFSDRERMMRKWGRFIEIFDL